MTEVKVHGIVVAEAVMGDKDKRLVLLTREMGKITVLAKGALSSKSHLRSVGQVFCCGRYVLTKGRTFYYIKEAELVNSFYGLRQDLDRLAWAELMVEAAAETAVDGRENRKLLDLLLRGLMRMQQSEEKPELVASVFLWRLMADNGYKPELDQCRLCGRKDEGRDIWGFIHAEGGVLCPDCMQIREPDRRLRPEDRYTLHYIVSAPEESVYRFRVDPAIREAVKEAACGYLQYQTGGRYKSLEFIRHMEREEELLKNGNRAN